MVGAEMLFAEGSLGLLILFVEATLGLPRGAYGLLAMTIKNTFLSLRGVGKRDEVIPML